MASRSGSRRPTAIVASCADDGAMAPDMYRPAAPPPASTCRRVLPAVPALGQAEALGDDQRRPVPPGPAAGLDQRHVEAGLRRDQGPRRQEQHPSARRSRPPSRKFWEATAPAVYWPVARSVATAPGRDAIRERAPAGRGRDGHGRRAHRRVRRQVHLQLLAPGHGHPQWRSRRQRCHRARSGLDTLHRHADAPRVSRAPTASSPRRSAPCSRRSIGNRPRAEAELGQLDRWRRRARRGRASTSSSRRSPSRASTMASTTATPPRSARRWGRRSASWP